MIINDLDGYYIVFDTKNWNTELDTLLKYVYSTGIVYIRYVNFSSKCIQPIEIFSIFTELN